MLSFFKIINRENISLTPFGDFSTIASFFDNDSHSEGMQREEEQKEVAEILRSWLRDPWNCFRSFIVLKRVFIKDSWLLFL
jgi:hypothetical protein